MTEEEIKILEDELGKISPWPWFSDRSSHICSKEGFCVVWADSVKNDQGGYNSDFISKAPSRIRALLDEVDSLESSNDILRIQLSSAIMMAGLNESIKDGAVENLKEVRRLTAENAEARKMNIFEKTIHHFGEHRQMVKACEECAELIQALTKSIGWNHSKAYDTQIEDEIADVAIVLEQMKILFPGYKERLEFKLKRLEELVK